MACNPLNPVSCLAGAVSDAATASLGNSFADAMREGASWVIKTTIGWWIEVPSIDLAASPAGHVRSYVWWLSLVVAVAGVAWQGARMAVTHRVDPLLDIGRGLVTLALWAGIGITGPAVALRAGDSFSTWVLDQAASGQVSDRLIRLAGLTDVNSAGAAIVLGLLMMVAGLVQAVLMIFREGAVVVLAGVLVLAAAGNVTSYGRPWLMKVLGWMVALIAYKPVAALVYAVALTLTGDGTDPRTVVVGLSMMAMSVIALPALTKFFTWASGSAGGGGSLAGLVGLSAAGIQAAAAMRSAGSGSGGDAASAHASQMRADLGPAASSPTGAGNGAAPTAAAGAGAAGGAAGSTTAAGGLAASGAATGGTTVALLAAKGAVDAGRQAGQVASDAMTDGNENSA